MPPNEELSNEALEALHRSLPEHVRADIDKVLLRYYRLLRQSPDNAVTFRSSSEILSFEKDLSADALTYLHTGLDDLELCCGILQPEAQPTTVAKDR